METIIQAFKDFTAFTNEANWAVRLISGLVILFFGWFIVNFIVKLIEKLFENRDFDPSLEPFLLNVSKWFLRFILLIVVAGTMGIQTASLTALVGAVGLAIGLALQGTLGHFASGIVILLTRPFKVGDYVQADGKEGFVREIQVFQTILETLQGNTIYLPNGNVTSNPIINVSEMPTRRIDLDFHVDARDSVKRARSIIMGIVDADTRILDEPKTEVPVTSIHNDSTVNMQLRTWVRSENYWETRFYLIETIMDSLAANDIHIPYPKSEVVLRRE